MPGFPGTEVDASPPRHSPRIQPLDSRIGEDGPPDPSHRFRRSSSLGIRAYRNPVAHPYEVVRKSVRLLRQRSQQATVQVRPWLQDFRDYAYDRRIFGVAEIRA